MSFRARLTIFFVGIVVVPMVAIGVLMFSLINDSQQGKADARAGGLAAEAGSLYDSEAASARTDAAALARAVGSLHGRALAVRFATLATQAGLARATASSGSRTIVDVGDRTAIAPGSVIVRDPAVGSAMTVTVSELTASQYARELSSPGVAIVVRDGTRTLASTVALPSPSAPGTDGNVKVAGKGYRAVEPDVRRLRRGARDRHRSVRAVRDRDLARG